MPSNTFLVARREPTFVPLRTQSQTWGVNLPGIACLLCLAFVTSEARPTQSHGDVVPSDPSIFLPKVSVQPQSAVNRRLAVSSDQWWFTRRRRATVATHNFSEEELDFANIMHDATGGGAEGSLRCWERVFVKELKIPRWAGVSTDTVGIWKCTCEHCIHAQDFRSRTSMQQATLELRPTVSMRSGILMKTREPSDPVEHHVGLKACALGFLGSDDIYDWYNNLDVAPLGEFCGSRFWHKGFVRETLGILQHPEWPKFNSYLKGCSRVIVMGHSLGGAIATLFATCMNANTTDKMIAFDGLNVEAELYTSGAPQTNLFAPKNERADDFAFKGARFTNYGTSFCIFRFCAPWCCAQSGHMVPVVVDPVPFLPGNLKHPKVASISIDTSTREVAVTAAISDEGQTTPSGFLFPGEWQHSVSAYAHAIQNHA